MTVHSIRRTPIGSKSYCSRNMTVIQAAHRIAELDANALAVISEDGDVEGIITDHDIIRAIANGNMRLGKTPVEACMSAPVITCDDSTRLSEALKLMGKHRIRHLVVVSNGAFVRLLTIKDLLEKIHEDKELEFNVLRDMAMGRMVQAE
ncbi:MAG: CBS domain-containing protein [Ruegeria sp.]|uniref:CBS domain-containing protein n=1 Tax=Ruegeria sp. TaxID=1879320 RepID=UPI00349EDC1D